MQRVCVCVCVCAGAGDGEDAGAGWKIHLGVETTAELLGHRGSRISSQTLTPLWSVGPGIKMEQGRRG